jgi:hypothetical protein
MQLNGTYVQQSHTALHKVVINGYNLNYMTMEYNNGD